MSGKAIKDGDRSTESHDTEFSFYEFFAGGGVVRAGLGNPWRCLFANNMGPIKASTYIDNWGGEHFDTRDVHEIPSNGLPRHADLTWTSFPCQDLSPAGNGLGIGDRDSSADEITRSDAVRLFLDLIGKLNEENRKPPLLALENVLGLLTLNQGGHFATIYHQLGKAGYRYGTIIVDAKHFLPQSRPRVLIVVVSRHISIPTSPVSEKTLPEWHSSSLIRACDALAEGVHDDWA